MIQKVALPNSQFVIHQLSDLHIGTDYKASSDVETRDPQRRINLTRYLKRLNQLKVEESDSFPDLIVISGDLTSGGREDHMNEAEDFINKLVQEMETTPRRWRKTGQNKGAPHVVMVPGNHDLDWKVKRQTHSTKIRNYAELAERLYEKVNVLSPIYSNSSNKPVHFDYGDDLNLVVYLFDTTSLGGTFDDGLKRVHSVLKRTAGLNKVNLKEAARLISEKMRRDPGFISRSAIEKMERQFSEFNFQAVTQRKTIKPKRVVIGVMHHNLTTVISDELHVFDTIINAGEIKNQLIKFGFDIILHGHRHTTHCCQERNVQTEDFLEKNFKDGRNKAVQGIYVIGADAFKEKRSSYNELKLKNTHAAHGKLLPASSFELKDVAYEDASGFTVGGERVDIIGKQLHSALCETRKYIGQEVPNERRRKMLEQVEWLIEPFHDLCSDLVGWDQKHSREWTHEFGASIGEYSCIYATDVQMRRSSATYGFDIYTQEQFREREKRIFSTANPKVIYFSGPLSQAIKNTGWRPPSYGRWKHFSVEHTDDPNCHGQLQIVRILIRRIEPSAGPKAENLRSEIKALKFWHDMFAIPLFVIEPAQLPTDLSEGERATLDLAIGVTKNGKTDRVYKYEATEQSVVRINDKLRSQRYIRTVERMLKQRTGGLMLAADLI